MNDQESKNAAAVARLRHRPAATGEVTKNPSSAGDKVQNAASTQILPAQKITKTKKIGRPLGSTRDKIKATRIGKRVQVALVDRDGKVNPLITEQVRVPPPPMISPAYDRELHDDQQMSRVEALMLKGVTEPRLLMGMLQITERKRMDRYIARIQVRWSALGGSAKLKSARGLALSKLDLVQNELWVMASSVRDSDHRAFIAVMQQIRENVRFQSELQGITPAAIERMNMAEDGANPAMLAMGKNERLASLFKDYMKLISVATNASQDEANEIMNGDADASLT
jgi:hypothetical protein